MTVQTGTERDIARLAFSVADAVRNEGSFGWSSLRDVTQALALDAARWWSDRSGRPLPELLVAVDNTATRVPESVLDVHRQWLQAAPPAELRRYVPLLAYHLGTRAGAGEAFSSPSLAATAVVAAVARTRPDDGALTLADYVAGSGFMLAETATALQDLGCTPRVIAQELNPRVAAVAAATLFMSSVDADVRVADSLVVDEFADVWADLAVSQPPFGLSWDRVAPEVRRLHKETGWYGLGLPRVSDSSWLFASRLIEKLTNSERGGGRAVVFMAPGALLGDPMNPIRKAVLERDLLETVVALPGGLTPSTQVPLYALVFANRKSGTRSGKVQVVNLRAYFATSTERHATSRSLRTEALEVLTSALAGITPGVASRTLPTEYFLRRRVTCRVPQPPPREVEAPVVHAEWDADVPLSEDVQAYVTARYGSAPVTFAASDRVHSRVEIESIFDESGRQLRQWARGRGWRTSRLSALITGAPSIWDPDASNVTAYRLLLPTGTGDASVSSEAPEARGRVLALPVNEDAISIAFLAGWLNSPMGREARRLAYERAATGHVINAVRTEPRALMRFLDELTVPLPDTTVQEAVASAETRLSSATRLVERARRDLWEGSVGPAQLLARFDPLFDESLVGWANDLPYPVASALWTLESKRQNLDAAHKQSFLVWEAYAAFLGIVLLSALEQDPALRDEETPLLRAALYAAGLTMARATLGGWNVIVQRLASRFRALLAGDDPDERARVLQVFGSPSHETLERLLSTTVVRVISEANNYRNQWDGHAGAVPEHELAQHIKTMDNLLEQLRDEIGTTWRELKFVRAGDGYREDQGIVQRVELALGPNTPFRQEVIAVGDLMRRGELYLLADHAPQPLRLQHLLVLRRSPGSAQYACYFYNRLEGDDVRLVSYHLADRSEVTEHLSDVSGAVYPLVAGGR